MKKWIKVIVLLAMIIWTNVMAETPENSMINQFLEIYGQPLQEGVDMIDEESLEGVIPDFRVEDLLKKTASGKSIFSPKTVVEKILALFFKEVRNTLKLMIFIPIVAIISGFASNMQDGFKTKGAARAAFVSCYAVLAGIIATAFFEVISCSKGLVENISIFMRVMLPVALACTAAGGGIITASSFEMLLAAVIEITEWVLESVFIPLVLISAALNIANSISTSVNCEKLVACINKVVKWGFGILLTLFVGIMSLQGIAAASADGLTVRMTRFATSSLIPMVGGILSETVETVMNCSVVIKNSVGIVGIILIVGISVLPVLKIAACLIMFRGCAALIQPISDERTTKCVSETGDCVSVIFSMTVAVVVMFIIMLTIIINAGNSALLLGK